MRQIRLFSLYFIFIIVFKTKKNLTKTKDRYCIIAKDSNNQEDIAIINTFAPNRRPPKYTKQKWIWLKGEIYNPTIIVKDFNTLLKILDKTTKLKINKSVKNVNTLNSLDLKNI